MTIPLNHFAQQIVASGLLSGEDVRTLIDALPAEQRPRDAEQLARELVRQKRLTAYQAQQIQAGQGRSLVLGNYVILDKLGQGGMGLVLKAEHRRMKRVVALKVLSPQVTRTPELVRRFQREVEAAAKLSHPNIVVAHDADEVGDTHFLVMEYVEGTDLSTLVKQRGPLPIDQALDYIVQAARGLEYAHQHGVIHRDIKPANLLVSVVSRPLSVGADDRTITADHGQPTTDHGQPTILKILDMGLARVQSAGGEQDELTGSGQIMGTVDYMAPEQAANTKRADQRAHIYSLGITLWYLLTARPAYPGDSAVEKLMAHQTQPIPSLRSLRSGVSPSLDAVFAKMVAKTPEARYQTMTEVIAALESCRSRAASAAELEATLDMSSPQVPTDPKTQASLAALRRPWWQDRRIALAAGGLLLVLLAVWIAGEGWESFSDNDASSSKGTPPNTPPAPVAADLKSEIADLKFEEPPPLEEWLKGRTILTVAQDGRGQFRTIAEAVKALKPGQVVEILDQGPYRENLWIEDPPADTGLLSHVNTMIQAVEWRQTPSLSRRWGLSHCVYAPKAREFRISGLSLLYAPDALSGFDGFTVVHFDLGARVQIDNTAIVRHPAAGPSKGLCEALSVCYDRGSVIRNCIFLGSVTLVPRGRGVACLVQNNWFIDGPAVVRAGITENAVVLQRNVFHGRGVVLNDAAGVRQSYIQGCTVCENPLLNPGSVYPHLYLWRNLIAAPLVPAGHTTSTVVDEWSVGENLIWPRIDAGSAVGAFGIGTIVEEPQWLSLDPHDHRNYMRVSNPSVVLNRDGRQEYIGALPPGPAPPEGDWFTRLLERWEEVQQRIEKLSADDAGGGQEPAAGSPGTALPAAKPSLVRPRP